MNQKQFDVWFTIVRKPTDIFISSYFQDIDTNSYPYFWGDKTRVLQTPVPILMNHFLQFKWDTFTQCNYLFNFYEIFKYTGIRILGNTFDKEKGYSIYQSPIKKTKVVVLTIESLSKIEDILKELGIATTKKFIMKNANIGEEKWYKNKYKEFKKMVPPSFFEKYKETDDLILNHFYK